MGVVESINPLRGRFPKQSDQVGFRTEVCFHYDSSQRVGGTIIRDDAEDPWRTIIQLDDGPLVLSTECQYTPPTPPPQLWNDIARSAPGLPDPSA